MIESDSIALDERAERAQRFASLGEFAAGVARDLQALLLPIDEHALALCHDACGNRAAEGRLRQILTPVGLARDLANQVLIFSRGQTRERRTLSVGGMVREALPLMRAVIANTTLLRIAVDAQAPLVDASPVAIQRVLLNLVQNSSRAIRQPHGVIEIGVAGMPAAENNGTQFVRLTVADNGIGMDAAALGELQQQNAGQPCAVRSAGL